MASTWAEMCSCPDSGPNYLAKLVDTFTSLMNEYNGKCVNMKQWNKRRQILHNLMNDGLTDNNVSAKGECGVTKPDGYTEHQTAWGTVWTKIFDDFYTWQEGKDLCADDGDFLHMPIPENIDQNDFYFNLVGPRSDRDLWLDINDYETEGTLDLLC